MAVSTVAYPYGETATTRATLCITTDETPTEITYTAWTVLEVYNNTLQQQTYNYYCYYEKGTTVVKSGTFIQFPTSEFVSHVVGQQSVTVSKTSSTQTIKFRSSYTAPGGISEGYTETITIPALVEYTVTYSAGSVVGVTNIPAAQTKLNGVALILSGQSPLRTGYIFTGWNTEEDGSGAYYTLSGTYVDESNVTLYAQWELDYARIYYYGNGNGDDVQNVPADEIKYYNVNYTISNTIPTRTGYDFYKWSTEPISGAGTEYDPGDTYTGNTGLLLYALWTPYQKPQITGSNGAEIPLVIRSQSDGTPDLFGTYALVEFDWQTFASTGSEARIYYKLPSQSWPASTDPSVTTISLSGTSRSESAVIGGGSLDITKTYNVRVVVEDSTGGKKIFITTLTMAFITLDFGGAGKAIGVGTEAPDPTGHSNGIIKFAMDMVDKNGRKMDTYDTLTTPTVNTNNTYYSLSATIYQVHNLLIIDGNANCSTSTTSWQDMITGLPSCASINIMVPSVTASKAGLNVRTNGTKLQLANGSSSTQNYRFEIIAPLN